MNYNEIKLKDIYNLKGGILKQYVTDTYCDENIEWEKPVVIVVPGGNYEIVSKREAEPVGYKFLAEGFHVFILDYLTMRNGISYPEELLELACSIDYIKEHHKELHVNKGKIFIVGFSAGGHLAGSISTDYMIAKNLYKEKDLDCKVNGAGLIYPVINDLYGYKSTHECLFKNVDEETKKNVNYMRLDEMVNKNTVPTFLFSTNNDQVVPSLNSLKYAQSLVENKIPYELHVYKNGMHGLSTCEKDVNPFVEENIIRNRNWVHDCVEFFREID